MYRLILALLLLAPSLAWGACPSTLTDCPSPSLNAVAARSLTLAGSGTALAVTNNATVGGTLGVTSNATIGGTLGVTGTATVTGVLTANAASNGLVVANQATFGGKIVVNNSTARTLTIDDSGGTSARIYVGTPSTNFINVRSKVIFTGGGTPQSTTENFFNANDGNTVTLSGSQYYRHLATAANIGGSTTVGIQANTFGVGSTANMSSASAPFINVYRSLAVGNGAQGDHVGSQDYVVLNAAGSTNVYATGASSIVEIQSNSGGTNTTGTLAKGTYFGRNTAVWLKNSFTGLTGGAKYSQAAVGDEINMKVEGTQQTITVGGTPTNGDTIQVTFTSGSIVGSPVTVTATVGTSNALDVIANKVAAAINANTALLNAGVGARVRSGSVVHVTWPFPTSITLSKNVTGAATETATLSSVSDGASTSYRRILQLVPETFDTARGWSGDDSIIHIGGQNTSPSGLYPYAIAFGGQLGQWPITYDGAIIAAVPQISNSGSGTNAQLGAQAAKYGIKFDTVDFTAASGASLKVPGFSVSGSGAVTLGSTILSQASTDFRIDAAGYVVTAIAISAAGGGGSGATLGNYFVGDLVYDAYGGLYRVATIDNVTGGIATFTIVNPSRISSGATPANPVALSGGSGTGATATLTWSSQVTTIALNPTTLGPVTAGGTFTAAGNIATSAYFRASASNSLTATGTTRADALALTKGLNRVTTTAAGTGVVLPAASTVGVGGSVVVYNAGANVLKVYAAGSDTIDGTAGSTGVNLTNALRCEYKVIEGGVWISSQLGAISS